MMMMMMKVRRPGFVLISKKKRNCHLLDFAFPVELRKNK